MRDRIVLRLAGDTAEQHDKRKQKYLQAQLDKLGLHDCFTVLPFYRNWVNHSSSCLGIHLEPMFFGIMGSHLKA